MTLNAPHTFRPTGQTLGPAPRSYVVGLPVIVSVDDDGNVEVEVDLSEFEHAADEAIGDGDAAGDDTTAGLREHLTTDAAAVEAFFDRYVKGPA